MGEYSKKKATRTVRLRYTNRGAKERQRPRRGSGNLPAREVLAVFSKPATYSGFADPPKPRTGTSSMWRHRSKDFESKKETPPSIESVQRAAADPTGLAAAIGYLSRPFSRSWASSLSSPFLFTPSPSSCSRSGPRSPTQKRVRL